jgi:hypothetical protein
MPALGPKGRCASELGVGSRPVCPTRRASLRACMKTCRGHLVRECRGRSRLRHDRRRSSYTFSYRRGRSIRTFQFLYDLLEALL